VPANNAEKYQVPQFAVETLIVVDHVPPVLVDDNVCVGHETLAL
jgi:hypothetical protein